MVANSVIVLKEEANQEEEMGGGWLLPWDLSHSVTLHGLKFPSSDAHSLYFCFFKTIVKSTISTIQ